MKPPQAFPTPQKGWQPIILLSLLTLVSLFISLTLVNLGLAMLFIPIFFACLYYAKRGFVFSVLLVGAYFFLTITVLRDPNLIWVAVIRVPIFLLVAGVISYLSLQMIRGEEALRNSEARLNSIVQGSPTPQFVIDKDHRIISWNKAIEEYSGVTETQVLGTRDQWKAFYPEERPVLADILVDEKVELLSEWYEDKIRNSRFFEGAYEATGFFPGMGKSGKWLYFTAAPIRDAGGVITGAVETLEDITERKHAVEALSLANKKLNLLSSITRHDINNQLTVLIGYLTILKKKQPDNTHIEYFQKIATAAERISAMIRFTKEYESIGIAVPAWQNCRTLVDTAVQQAPLGKVLVKNDLPAGTEVFADPLIIRVFYNLMDNAVRYGGKITTIRFSVEEHNSDHILVCEDDGDGVPASEKMQIFAPGFGQNTGLGLALSLEILDITGITIRETGQPCKGARFEMTVPKGAWRMDMDTDHGRGGDD